MADDSTTEGNSIEWFIDNQFHDQYWDKVRQSHISYSSIIKKSKQKEASHIDQNGLLDINNDRIDEIYKDNLLSTDELMEIIKDKKCVLIKKLNIPNDIIISIVSFVGNGIIPISYSLSYLPFYRAVSEHKLYRDTLKKWWDEIRINDDHKGIFYPKTIKNAAIEFQQFFTERLAENGKDKINREYVKYHRYMIPTIAVNMNPNILNDKYLKELNIKNKKLRKIRLNLPTASGSSACIGGIELFQRLYLETSINGEYGIFDIDLICVRGSHGDNWCFDGNGYVLMENNKYKKISELEIGDNICSFPGNKISKIECIIISNINDFIEMVELNNKCWITFEHPILINLDKELNINLDIDLNEYKNNININKLDSDIINKLNLFWVLPKNIFPVQYRYQDKIFNFILNKNHTINVNGNWCCTLAHDYKGNVIQHTFWGNSINIHKFLKQNSKTYPYVVFG